MLLRLLVILLASAPFGAIELLAGPIQWQVSAGGNGHWYDLTAARGAWY